MRVRLERLDASDHGTFGRIALDGFACFTGELPDRGNAPAVSSILRGVYQCLWTFSPAFKKHLYLVAGVPGRSGVRIHGANLMGDASRGFKSQLQGCIALGERLGTFDGQKGLLVSVPAVRRFETYLRREPFELEIVG